MASQFPSPEPPPSRRSLWARAVDSKPPVIAPLALVTLATSAAVTIPDPFKRAITVLGCVVVQFLVGWLTPSPKE